MKPIYVGMALCCSALLLRADTAQERLHDATQVLQEVMSTPDKGIPQDLIEKAHCAVIVPGMKQGAFIVGGKFGRGFAVCRNNSGGGWGAPAAVRVEGGSVGFQIGGSNTDVIMLVMSERGMRRLLEDKFTVGANAQVAAGPVGRAATAETDVQLSADILSWSRSQGLFAGVALQGATLRGDEDVNKELYGRPLHNKEILMTNMKAPAAAEPLIADLDRYSRHEAANKPVETRAKDALDNNEASRADTTPEKHK